jgi:hypothetical protein
MTLNSRELVAFDPLQDWSSRWSAWKLRLTPLPGDCNERFYPDSREVHIDPAGDPEWAVAHATAHLDLRHHLVALDGFTPEQEADADGLARLRLDMNPDL